MIAETIRTLKKNWKAISLAIIVISFSVSAASLLSARGLQNSDANRHYEILVSENIDQVASSIDGVKKIDRDNLRIYVDSGTVSEEALERTHDNSNVTEVRTVLDTTSIIPFFIEGFFLATVLVLVSISVSVYLKIYKKIEIEPKEELTNIVHVFGGLLMGLLSFSGLVSLLSYVSFVEFRTMQFGLLSIIVLWFIHLLESNMQEIKVVSTLTSFIFATTIVAFSLAPSLLLIIVSMHVSILIGYISSRTISNYLE